MISPEYKVTIQRCGTYLWRLEVWEHPTEHDKEYLPWRRVGAYTTYNWEGHLDTPSRLRAALRGLVA